jgi:hypothetical protein
MFLSVLKLLAEGAIVPLERLGVGCSIVAESKLFNGLEQLEIKSSAKHRTSMNMT